jgi:hypothetical protein
MGSKTRGTAHGRSRRAREIRPERHKEAAPLLAEITRLGGSAKQIKVPSVKGWVATIDMPEFIKWSKGATAPKAAFDGVPTKADGVDAAIKQYLKKKP